jgi:hypothetical protein
MSAKRLMDLFAGLTRAYGTYHVTQVEQAGKQTGQAVTKRAPVTIELWQGHLDGNHGIGIVPICDDNTCQFGAIDVDGNSGKYHGFDASKFALRAAELGFPIIVCRSKSGGAHLYIFASEPVSAAYMQARLREMLPYFGLPKDVEIFPKQVKISATREDIGSWINMPYFKEKETVRYAYSDEGKELSLEAFLTVAEQRRQPASFFATPIPPPTDAAPQILVAKPKETCQPDTSASVWFPDGPPCLQKLGVEGVPAGNRNNALLNVGRYFKIVGDDWREKARECNQEIFDPPLEPVEVNTILRQVEGRGYQYTCRKEPLLSRCDGAICRGRKYGVGRDGKGGIGAPQGPKEEAVDDRHIFTEEGVSDGFPILGQLRMLTTSFDASDAVRYFLDVNGEPVPLEPADLEDPRRFRSKIMHRRTGIMMRLPTSDSWERMVNDLLSRKIIVELPEEASQDGLLWFHFTNFCRKYVGKAKDEIISNKTWENDGRVWFQLTSLIAYINRYHREFKISQSEIISIFTRRGVTPSILSIRGVDFSVWGAPRLVELEEKKENLNEGVVM